MARPSVYGDDALAGCRTGPPLQRGTASCPSALRLDTKDPLLDFHRGYAEGCTGDRDAMREWYERALELNPEFSIRWAPVARAALR